MFVNTVANNIANNVVYKEEGNGKRVVALLLAVLLIVLVNIVLGPYLWNTVARRLIPALGKARWYDTVLLSVLISLLVAN